MKKGLIIGLIVALCAVITVVCIVVFGGKDNSNTSSSGSSSSELLNFEGITFDNETIEYDGAEHTITANGLPADATVNYGNAGPFVDAGSYVITLTVEKSGYNKFEAQATLKINPVDFTGITFDSKTFEYDGTSHEITITGSLPSTASVSYSSDTSGIKNSATEIGSYLITATITDKNHNTLNLTATLKITATDQKRHIAYAQNGILYFQNAMDNNEFYAYNSSNGSISRISGDNVKDIIVYGNDGVMFVSNTLFISSIKRISYNGIDFESEASWTQGGISYLQAEGTIVYFVINGLTNESSGIYRVDYSEQEPVAELLSAGKAYYLQLSEDTLYFADGANDKKLSCINTSALNQQRTLVVDKKVNNLVYDNGNLYYTVNNLLGNYIEKYNLSSQVTRKLTMDAGESLTVIGDMLYYVNVDVFTTNYTGKGIYMVSTDVLVDNNSTGTLVIDGGEMGVCSLTSDGENLYYYDVDGYKLMKYNLNSQSKKNLLSGFVKPEDPTPISTGSKVMEYNGNIYYLDIWDEKTLHCYNPVNKQNYRITTQKVVDFNIIGDILYVNMVSLLVNNDLYVTNLKTGSPLEKISTYSAYDFCSDGNYLYYVEENAVGARTAIHKCDLNGENDEIIFDKGVTNLKLVGDKLFFIEGNNIYSFDLATKTQTVIKVGTREIHTTAFDTDGTYIYYRDMYGLAWGNKRLSRCKLDGSENVVLTEEDVDPVNIVYSNGYVYYYSDTTLAVSKNGLYRIDASATTQTTPQALLLASEGLYAKDFIIVNDTIYFVDYLMQAVGNAHLYSFEIGKTPTLIK